MEAIAYILVWMFAGRLPWNGLRDKNMSERDYRALVLKMKLEFKAFVEHQLHKEWSPQQIMSYLGLSQQPPSELSNSNSCFCSPSRETAHWCAF